MTARSQLAQTFARGVSATFVAMAASAAVAVVAQVVVSRTVGVEEFGRYVYVIGWINLIVVGAVLGFEATVVRFTSTYLANADWSKLRGLIRTATAASAVLSTLMAIVFAGAVVVLVDEAPLRWTFVAGSLLLPFVGAGRIAAAALQGAQRVAVSHVTQGIVRPAGTAVGLLTLAALLGRAPVSWEAVVVTALAAALSTAVAWAVVRRTLGAPTHVARAEYDRTIWLQSLRPNTVMTGAQTLLAYSGVVMLGLFSDTVGAGKFSVATQLAAGAALGIGAINSIMAPLMAALHAKHERGPLQQSLRLASQSMLAYALVTGGVIVAGHRPLLALYGPGFEDAWVSLGILAFGQIVVAYYGPVGFLATMTGHERQASRFVVSSAAGHIALCCALIPLFGTTGAAAATAIASGLRSVLLARWIRKHLGYYPGPWRQGHAWEPTAGGR